MKKEHRFLPVVIVGLVVMLLAVSFSFLPRSLGTNIYIDDPQSCYRFPNSRLSVSECVITSPVHAADFSWNGFVGTDVVDAAAFSWNGFVGTDVGRTANYMEFPASRRNRSIGISAVETANYKQFSEFSWNGFVGTNVGRTANYMEFPASRRNRSTGISAVGTAANYMQFPKFSWNGFVGN